MVFKVSPLVAKVVKIEWQHFIQFGKYLCILSLNKMQVIAQKVFIFNPFHDHIFKCPLPNFEKINNIVF